MAATHPGPTSIPAAVRQLEIGFFIGDAAIPAPTSAQFTTRAVAGIPSLTQFFRIGVRLEDETDIDGEIWIVGTAVPTGSRKPRPTGISFDEARLLQVRAALAVALPNATLCFVIEDREGFSRVITDAERAPAIAAGVAVVKYFAAWDESDPINVTVNDEHFAVSVGFSEGAYRALVQPTARAAQQAVETVGRASS
jgi:hypothetical protein